MNTNNLQQTMRDAMALMRTGDLNAATAAIQRGLNDGTAHTRATPGAVPAPPEPIEGVWRVIREPLVPIVARRTGVPMEPIVAERSNTSAESIPAGRSSAQAEPFVAERSRTENESIVADRPDKPAEPTVADRLDQSSEPNLEQTSTIGTFVCAHGQRDYLVYAPRESGPRQPPLVLMLHGCTQNAADFARGTRMHERAAGEGYVVVYPVQPATGNPNGCWNWFRPNDQQRGSGEPAILAGLVAEMTRRFNCDPRRIFVAGLSAGGAMAVALGHLYPDMFRGVGAHSSLPYACAHDLPSALMAMRNANARSNRGADHGGTAAHVPTIVFHGDRDHTVNVGNAARIVDDAKRAPLNGAMSEREAWSDTATTRLVAGGHRSTTTRVRDASNKLHVESWIVHGAGHAWFGGSPQGSFTDARGPDATNEMLRFFGELS